MDETKNTPAIILNRRPYREHDALVTVYTLSSGKLTLAARGVKKLKSKLAGHIEPLALADILIIRGRGLDYLGSAVARTVYRGIRNDLNKLYYAGRVINLFNRLVKEEQPDERLFFLLADWLEALDGFKVARGDYDRRLSPTFSDRQSSLRSSKKSEDFSKEIGDFPKETGELFFSFFAWKLLVELGYAPEMKQCLIGREAISPGRNYFNLKNGGLVCEECFKKEPGNDDGFNKADLLTISDNCVKIIRFIINSDFSSIKKLKIEGKTVKEASNLVNNFINFHFSI